MTVEKLTPEERNHLMNTPGGWAQAVLDTCDALFLENERLREEKRLNDTDLANWRATSSRLAAATALLVRARKLVYGVVYEAIDAFLASVQPAAPTRTHDHENCDNPDCGTCAFNQPAAPTRTEAES